MKQFLFLSVIIFSVFFLFLYFWQRQWIYFPIRQTPERKAFYAEDMNIVTLSTVDGLNLNAWYKPAAQIAKPTILYFHGNAGHIGYRMPLARQFLSKGYGVFLLEYRGYGGNEGSPSEQGLYEDGRAAIQFLEQNGVDSEHLVLFGESLGTAIAIKMAREHPVCAVVLQAPFTSLVDLARYHYPWAFLKPWDRYNSLQRIKKINAPLLILHGKRDQIVPIAQAKTLFEAAMVPKDFKLFEAVGHNDIWNAPDYIESIAHFLLKHCTEHLAD